jgi:hypothetical protein
VVAFGVGVPDVVLVEHLPLFFLDLLHLALSLLLKLVREWHE